MQFLVSKLVLCYSPYDNDGENPVACSSDVLPLLRELILHSDASLYEYIKVSFSALFSGIKDSVFIM